MLSHALTESEKTTIEEKVRAILSEIINASEQVDVDRMVATASDVYNVGFLDNGVFFPSLAAFTKACRTAFGNLQNQRINVAETRISVLAADVAVLTACGHFTATVKSGDSFENDFVWTFVLTAVEDEWKVIHSHESIPHPVSD